MALHHDLKRLRKRAGKTQTSLRAVVGLGASGLSEVESGAKTTTVEKAERWAAACGGRVMAVELDLADALMMAVELLDGDDVRAILAALPMMTPRERRVWVYEAKLVTGDAE